MSTETTIIFVLEMPLRPYIGPLVLARVTRFSYYLWLIFVMYVGVNSSKRSR